MPLARLLAAAAALAAYAVLSHALMVHAPDRPWAVAAVFGPLWAAVVLSAWAQRQRAVLAACALVAAGVAVVVAQGGVRDIQLMYVLQYTGMHWMLAWGFASTLRPGHKALITTMAERVHTRFPEAMRVYTRQLTAAWAIYFIGMSVLSWAIYLAAPWPVWSLFCNMLTPLAVGTFFIAEYFWRYWRHPDFERVSFKLMAQAWRTRLQPGTAPGPTP